MQKDWCVALAGRLWPFLGDAHDHDNPTAITDRGVDDDEGEKLVWI